MCYHPIHVLTPQGRQSVPCGHCLECLRKGMNDWTNRFDAELKDCKGKAVVFTLTYDDANVPKNYLYDGEIYRSASAYGFSNVDPLTGKLRNAFHGEHKKYSELPYKALQETGVDCSRILDFNVERKDSRHFVEQCKKLYHDYYNHYDAIEVESDRTHYYSCPTDSDYDFDCDCDLASENEIIEHLFKQVEVDDEYYLSSQEETKPEASQMRERPVMQFNSVRVQDVQDWIKRGRIKYERLAKKNNETVKKFKFFITAEYGPRTLRPHYHGIIFGVTADEIRFMAYDWQRKFGRKIQWENMDLSKGAGSYAAKYCSKGFFEHPLCARDFFYFKGRVSDVKLADWIKEADRNLWKNPYFSEYHSKHYERCIEIFGVDKPIVDPVFHLVSKGLGASYVDKNIDRFNEPLAEYTVKSLNKEYGENDQSELDELLSKLNTNFKYSRVTRKNGSEKVFTYGMPKYYRKKILGDALRAALTNYVQSEHVRVYQEKYRQVSAANPYWTHVQVSDYLDTEEKTELLARINQQVKSVKRYLEKSSI